MQALPRADGREWAKADFADIARRVFIKQGTSYHYSNTNRCGSCCSEALLVVLSLLELLAGRDLAGGQGLDEVLDDAGGGVELAAAPGVLELVVAQKLAYDAAVRVDELGGGVQWHERAERKARPELRVLAPSAQNKSIPRRRTRAYLGSAECTDYYNIMIEKAVKARDTARLDCLGRAFGRAELGRRGCARLSQTRPSCRTTTRSAGRAPHVRCNYHSP